AGGAGGAASPGMMLRHYAPRTPLEVVAALTPAKVAGAVGVLAWSDAGAAVARRGGAAAVAVLSPRGDPAEAAANLFAAIRRLDAAGVALILAERAPDEGLGRAINDRLTRAGRG
ncbi:MAG: Sua5 family C-terminal domain-containing protein, partial [Phycisphaeraceae bacterium]